MATVLIKRGLEANRGGITPAVGELIWTTDNKDLWMGDGATAGGIKITANVENSSTLTNYYNKTDSDNRFVALAGDTMTGALILNANPTVALGAATKQYVDGLIDSGMKSPDGYATVAGGDYPTDYKSSGAVHEGDTFYITSTGAGTVVGTATVNNGDLLVALADAPGNVDANWAIVESNRDSASETVAGVIEIATQAEVDAGTDTTRAVTPATLAAATALSSEAVEDIVGAMVTGNAENGIAVTYTDNGAAAGKLDFDVNDFDITLTGATTGTATVTNLANVSLATSIADLSAIGDVDYTSAPANTNVLQFDGTNWVAVAVDTVGRTSFTALSDTPANYTGSADFICKVNSAGDAVEFSNTIDAGTF